MTGDNLTKTPNSHEEHYETMIKDLTGSFMAVMAGLKARDTPPETITAFEKLYQQVLNGFHKMRQNLKQSAERYAKAEKVIQNQAESIQRLETLYTAGITFASQTERDRLLQTAIDIVEKALQADAGYIVLVDSEGQVVDKIGSNLDPESEENASNLSMTVIRETMQASQPSQIADTDADQGLAERTSILLLDIKSTLCVPLVLGGQVKGAVYVDRRKKVWPFSAADLAFLLAFARQIVRGLKVSEQMEKLEKKLISDATLTMESLRKEFSCSELIGNSPQLLEVLRLASRIAPTDLPVLITGESGTGKELIARAIHINSLRPQGAFVAINCSAIPANLLESELFGYEKGAFTGAVHAKPGKIETANGGTLFLDEIGELSIALQAKLLRVIQAHELQRLGSNATQKIDVRFLAATNRNIEKMIKEGEFREDLYYRLNVITICMPPLRERREDIEELTHYFLAKHSRTELPLTISDDALDLLENYSWPGNIRELENVILRATVLAKSAAIEVADLPPELVKVEVAVPRITLGKSLADAEAEFRKRYIHRTLQQCSSKKEAAQRLGVNRTHFYKMLARLGLDEKS